MNSQFHTRTRASSMGGKNLPARAWRSDIPEKPEFNFIQRSKHQSDYDFLHRNTSESLHSIDFQVYSHTPVELTQRGIIQVEPNAKSDQEWGNGIGIYLGRVRLHNQTVSQSPEDVMNEAPACEVVVGLDGQHVQTVDLASLTLVLDVNAVFAHVVHALFRLRGAPVFRRGVAWRGVPQWQCWRVPTWHDEAFQQHCSTRSPSVLALAALVVPAEFEGEQCRAARVRVVQARQAIRGSVPPCPESPQRLEGEQNSDPALRNFNMRLREYIGEYHPLHPTRAAYPGPTVQGHLRRIPVKSRLESQRYSAL
ncbi:hypothetical protein B0H16DRAFT_1807815 [Mycena metata]|uniref:Uncharacterized protein n=1 Tax=Mycena metata TaxID=1033252 RepID=A0AAD7MF44_9AGAR|nr:hypothetical protein B0H16DRAFT_1807815 [Mycena metata]